MRTQQDNLSARDRLTAASVSVRAGIIRLRPPFRAP